ncbi:hypothetical protein [Kineococcus sp. R86509]|uniref:hypothetical protein n=1 Tax=Kineococcus sp. R86509 TaxID=3093851 RepID=UPI0036D2D9EC
MSTQTTPTGIPIEDCATCGYRHPVTRTHCTACGKATLFCHPGAARTPAHEPSARGYGVCETSRYLDSLTCPCGNQPHASGFYPSTMTAQEVSPDRNGAWDERHVACASCGRVFDQTAHDETTGRVPVVAGPQTFTPLPAT